MPAISTNPAYALDCDEEPLRLERQTRLYGTDDDLARMAPSAADRVLDAGCGAGSLTREIARRVPEGTAVGLDREPRYLDYARRQAASEELDNIRFEVGDATRLPFADGSFDLVWSKHLLQWVPDRKGALGEFVRVTRPGGRVVCCNFDGFCLSHHPTDERIQADLERWFKAAREELGFDNWLGSKLPAMFKQSGLRDVRAEVTLDKAFSGFGGDPERQWNWEVQFRSVLPFSEQVFGGRKAAVAFTDRVLQHFADPDVYFHCTLCYVQGTVP